MIISFEAFRKWNENIRLEKLRRTISIGTT
jgi:hypothetical protein